MDTLQKFAPSLNISSNFHHNKSNFDSIDIIITELNEFHELKNSIFRYGYIIIDEQVND